MWSGNNKYMYIMYVLNIKLILLFKSLIIVIRICVYVVIEVWEKIKI